MTYRSYYNNPLFIPRGSKVSYAVIHTKGGTILLTHKEFNAAKERATKRGYNK